MLENIKVSPGSPYPLGFSCQGNQANFSLFSSHATQVKLVLFNGIEKKEIPLVSDKNIWHIGIENLPEETEYAFQVEGAPDLQKGILFAQNYLADPYSKVPSSSSRWGEGIGSLKSRCSVPPPFDWQGILPPQIPKKDLIIYEMHVRGFTQHPSSSTSHPGTFLGIIEKIPYLKKLGVNAVELMPIFEFNELQEDRRLNYWGYNPLYFFAPMRRFAFQDPILEFKTLVRELHRNGIEVFLDVVYNHTGEGKTIDDYVHFKGIDNPVYYMVNEQGKYRNFTGCFNTFNVNHPIVTQLILESLRYWVEEMKVDGFRFDLASIFNRGCDGRPINPSPILQAITSHPAFKNTKLIAEPWDAVQLYQLGAFAKLGHWSEWNGLFRDWVRRFIKGTDKSAGDFAKVLCGSQFLYGSTNPLSSINFITAHDGFTLRDLVSYQKKRNLENGENNRDGNNSNENWNCGAEGESQDPMVHALREKQMRNFFLALFLSQGIPMLKMGDEYGHTSRGNNNPYVQDNELSWFLWDELKQQSSLFEFVSSLIAFRKRHVDFFHDHFLGNEDIEWHGAQPYQPNWSDSSRLVAFTLKGPSFLYVAFNAAYFSQTVHLPPNILWKEVVKTEKPWDQHHFNDPEKGAVISSVELTPYSVFIAKGSSLKENRLI